MKKILFIISSILMLTSCTGDFLKEYSQDLSRVTSFTDLDEVMVGSAFLPVGVTKNENYYIQQHNPNYILLHFMTDELEENLAPATNPDANYSYRPAQFPFYTWQENVCLDIKGNNVHEGTEANYWNMAYNHIATCNMVIAEADNLKATTKEDIVLEKKVRGEAHFLRALYYYVLANLYGAPYAPSTAASTPCVPIKTSAFIEDKEYSRNSVKEVYEQIIADLGEAEHWLADIHTPQSYHRVSLNAVYVFRSRIATYMQDWEGAQRYAELSLKENNRLQPLVGADPNVAPLNPNNVENIFSMGGTIFGTYNYVRPGQDYYGTPYSPVWKISDHLLSLYEENDARKYSYFSSQYGEGNSPYYCKIDISFAKMGTYKGVSDQFLFRSAEAYLNLAEALAHQGKDAEAMKQLRTLRKARVEDDDIADMSGADLISFIREERQREFCLEGQRWFDMRRYAVDAQYPLVETVTHTYTTYKYVSYKYYPDITYIYELRTDDGGMTLNIPKAVRDFQPSIGSNKRAERKYVSTIAH